MVKIALGPMTTEHLDDVLCIEQDIYEFPWSRKNFSDSLASGYRCICLWLDDQLAGYGILMKVLDECHLLNLSIAGAWQSQGWGKYLLGWCQRDAFNHRCSGLLLEVRPTNSVARTLYEKTGFKLIGVRKNYYPAFMGREDAIVMFKQLEST